MSDDKKLSGGTLAVIAVGALIVGYIVFFLFIKGPKHRDVTDRKFEATPARLERGRYLVESQTRCFDCHSQRDFKIHGGPARPGSKGDGLEWTGAELPGIIVSKNITSDPETGVGSYTDDELARAIREGVSKEGRALLPLMPFLFYAYMSDEDLASVVVYIRSLPPIKKALPKTEIDFIPTLFIRGYPKPITAPVPSPNMADPIAHGQYVATLSGCLGCHTPQDEYKRIIMDKAFSGGQQLKGPWGNTFSPNITPDPGGLGRYNEASFIKLMRTGRRFDGRRVSPVMPWNTYRNMTDDDLKALFAFLNSLKPIKHDVGESPVPEVTDNPEVKDTP